jgi:hypothetical protein
MKYKYRQKTNLAKSQGKRHEKGGGEARLRLWLWIAAVLLAITFLAGEFVNLLPID